MDSKKDEGVSKVHMTCKTVWKGWSEALDFFHWNYPASA